MSSAIPSLKGSPVGSVTVQLLGVAIVLLVFYDDIFGWPIGAAAQYIRDTFFDGKEKELLTYTCYALLLMMGAALPALLLGVEAAYGRYANPKWGPLVPNRLGWVVQELPVIGWGVWSLLRPDFNPFEHKTATVVGTMLMLHYVNRTLIFPFRLRAGKATPLTLVLLAMIFCMMNGYIQFRYLTQFSTYDDKNYEYFSPRFIIGTFLFMLGFLINNHSDTILMNLRAPGDSGYYIPYGGFFELVSGANFLGEIIEWTGFAIAANSLPGWTFAIGTFCNLAPRAVQHHKWYLKKFDNYPADRKALIPFVW